MGYAKRQEQEALPEQAPPRYARQAKEHIGEQPRLASLVNAPSLRSRGWKAASLRSRQECCDQGGWQPVDRVPSVALSLCHPYAQDPRIPFVPSRTWGGNASLGPSVGSPRRNARLWGFVLRLYLPPVVAPSVRGALLGGVAVVVPTALRGALEAGLRIPTFLPTSSRQGSCEYGKWSDPLHTQRSERPSCYWRANMLHYLPEGAYRTRCTWRHSEARCSHPPAIWRQPTGRSLIGAGVAPHLVVRDDVGLAGVTLDDLRDDLDARPDRLKYPGRHTFTDAAPDRGALEDRLVELRRAPA